MATEASSRHVHILVLDLTAEQKVEGPFDELGAPGAAEAAESGVTLIAVGGRTVEVENSIILKGKKKRLISTGFSRVHWKYQTYLFLATVLQGDAEDAAADVGVNGRLVASNELLEHLLGSSDDLLITAKAGIAK